jgi:two-component system sensor histidine kinase VicK
VGLFKKKINEEQAQTGGLAIRGKVNPDFILGAIEDGVIMVGRDNLVHLFNPAASKITGWKAEEAVGLDYRNVLSFIDDKGQPKPPGDNAFAQVLASGNTVKNTGAMLSTQSGKRIPLSLIVSPVMDAENKASGDVVGVFRDITQEKAEEAQRSDFISTASHEMRTPVAAIEGYLSLALNPKIAKIDDNAKTLLEKASASTKHLGVLFQDLLTSSRAEDGHLQSYPTVIEMGEIVQQVAESEKFQAKSKGLNLRYIVNSATPEAGSRVLRPLYYTYADPHRIQEVLQNLISNAIKYTPEGEIVIRLTGNDTVLQLQVQDTGPGIPPEDIPHLFQKFYRVDNSMTRTIGGTGLGLFICRKIIELYNGRIWAESQLGKGSAFFVNLPRLTTTQALDMQRKQASSASPLDVR